MKYARRADGNQAKIVEALRAAGCRVVPTHTIGQGFPDLIVDYHGRTCLIEIKDPTAIAIVAALLILGLIAWFAVSAARGNNG
jgi:hypothetical protein